MTRLRQEPSSRALDDCRVSRTLDGQVEIVEAGPRDRSFPDRVNESLGVVLKIGADHDVVADGRTLRYPRDAICVRPPGCVWSTASTGLVSFVSLDIEPSLLPPGRLGGTMGFIGADRLPGFRAHLAAIRSGAAPLVQEVAVTQLVEALHAEGLVNANEVRAAADAHVAQRARDLLSERLSDPPSLQALADAVGANRYVLLRAFRRRFGVPPHAFVLRLRVERARAMLARGIDVAEVAHALGFADQSHLTRLFKRVMGLAPANYRRRVVAARA